MREKHISFANISKVFLLFLLTLEIEISFADGFICDASITKKVVNRYQKLTRYKDIGELTTNRGSGFTFETIYIKPGDLKFIFHNPSGYGAYEKMSFIMSGDTVVSIFESNLFTTKKWKEKNVRSMLQSAAGVSSGSSLVIPPLLVGMHHVWTDEYPKSMVLELNNKGVTYCKVFFERISGAKETYWIRENGTIERFRRELTIPRHLVSDVKYQIIEMQ